MTTMSESVARSPRHHATASGALHRATHLLVATREDLAPLLLRVTLAVVIFPHGAQKLFGWFGGPGFTGAMPFFTETLGIPYALGALAIVTEVVGSAALVAGAFTRIAAAGMAVIMVVATALVHAPNGFFMNWYGAQAGEGFEYHLLALGIALALVVTGSGRWSIDRALEHRLR